LLVAGSDRRNKMARVNPAALQTYQGGALDIYGNFAKGQQMGALRREEDRRQEEFEREGADREKMQGILSQMGDDPDLEKAGMMLMKSGNIDAGNQLLQMAIREKESASVQGLRGKQARALDLEIQNKQQQRKNELMYEQVTSETGLIDRALENISGMEDPEQAEQTLDKFMGTIDKLNESRQGAGLNPIQVPKELKSGDINERIGMLQQMSELGNAKIEMLDYFKGEDEDFTLGAGQTRYDAQGNIIAQAPRGTGKAPTPQTTLGKLKADYDSGFITEEQYDQQAAAAIKEENSKREIIDQGGIKYYADTGEKVLGDIKPPKGKKTVEEIKAAKLAKESLENLDIVKKELFNKDGSIKSGVIPLSREAPFGKSRTFIQALERAIQNSVYLKTGAAAPESEMNRLLDQYMPNIIDNKEQINNKLKSFEGFLRSSYDPAAGTEGAPQVGAVQDGYMFKGGDPSKPESWEVVQ